MGIDFRSRAARTSDQRPHWAYSGFDRFRKRLANAIGLDLDSMKGFGGQRGWSLITDDLVPLLNHSDCSGELSADECRRVAPRLRVVLAYIAEHDEDDGYEKGYDIKMGRRLADMMDECANGGFSLHFN